MRSAVVAANARRSLSKQWRPGRRGGGDGAREEEDNEPTRIVQQQLLDKKKVPPVVKVEDSSSSFSSTTIPRVVWQDDDLAVVYKPAGMSVSGNQRDRAGVSLAAWWQQQRTTTTTTTTKHCPRGGGGRGSGRSVPTATAVVVTTPLHKAVGGLVVLAKTRGGYDYLGRVVRAEANNTSNNNNNNNNNNHNNHNEMECGYVALVAHSDEESCLVGGGTHQSLLLWHNFTVVSTTPAVLAPYLSLVRFTTLASIPTSTVCAALAQMQCPVVGTPTAGAGAGTPGGVHLALVDLTLPLLSRRDGTGTDDDNDAAATSHKGPAVANDAATTATATARPIIMEVHIDVPKKLTKTQRREMLHAMRRRALDPGDTNGISSSSSSTTTITATAICGGDGAAATNTNTTAKAEQQRVLLFMGVRLAVGTDQLRPRPSSQCLVRAATNILLHRVAVSSSSSSQQQLKLSVLDIGCGPGSLLLATLHGLTQQQLPLQKRTTTALLLPPIEVIGVGIDIDEAALAIAQANSAAAGNNNNGVDHGENLCNDQSVRAVRSTTTTTTTTTTTHWRKVDFGHLHETDYFGDDLVVGTRCRRRGFDVILCNPPYLRAAAAAGRITNERSGALYAGRDRLDAYRTLANSLGRCYRGLLAKETDIDDDGGGGVLLLQLPAYKNAAAAVGRIFEEANDNFCVRQVLPDDRGIDRCLVVSWRAATP